MPVKKNPHETSSTKNTSKWFFWNAWSLCIVELISNWTAQIHYLTRVTYKSLLILWRVGYLNFVICTLLQPQSFVYYRVLFMGKRNIKVWQEDKGHLLRCACTLCHLIKYQTVIDVRFGPYPSRGTDHSHPPTPKKKILE